MHQCAFVWVFPDFRVLIHIALIMLDGDEIDLRAERIANSEFIKDHDILVIEECFDNTPCNILRNKLLAECRYHAFVVYRLGMGVLSFKRSNC